MSIRLWALLGVALLSAVLRPAFAEDGEPLAFKDADKDFEWKLPAGWTSQPVSESEKEAGFQAKVRRVVSEGRELLGNVVVKDAAGAELGTFVAMTKENKTKALTEPEVTQDNVSWAGITEAVSVTILGKSDNGSAVKWFVRCAIVGGRYHQLSVVSYNGAWDEIGTELDDVLGGYHVLSAPPPGEGGGGEAGRLTRTFPKLGLTWTLPGPGSREEQPVKEGDPKRVWEWGFTSEGNPGLARGDDGLAAIAVVNFNNEAKIVARLELPKTQANDIPPAGIVKSEGNFEGLAKANFDGTPIPNIDENCKVGNARGAYHTLSGKNGQNGAKLWIRSYFVTLQTQLFLLRVIAHDGFEQSDDKLLKGIVDGLTWADTTVGVRGPLIAPFPTASADRPKWRELGKERKITGSINLKKPAPFGELSLADVKNYVWAGELRKAGVYLFVGVEKRDASVIGKGTPPFKLEALVDEHENNWRTELQSPDTRGKSGKANCKPYAFKGEKGFSYEFRGEKEGFPFYERGWIVVSKADIVWFRAQFGGKDAEKLLAKDAKDVESSISFK